MFAPHSASLKDKTVYRTVDGDSKFPPHSTNTDSCQQFCKWKLNIFLQIISRYTYYIEKLIAVTERLFTGVVVYTV